MVLIFDIKNNFMRKLLSAPRSDPTSVHWTIEHPEPSEFNDLTVMWSWGVLDLITTIASVLIKLSTENPQVSSLTPARPN